MLITIMLLNELTCSLARDTFVEFCEASQVTSNPVDRKT
jgi:hypothetical protein